MKNMENLVMSEIKAKLAIEMKFAGIKGTISKHMGGLKIKVKTFEDTLRVADLNNYNQNYCSCEIPKEIFVHNQAKKIMILEHKLNKLNITYRIIHLKEIEITTIEVDSIFDVEKVSLIANLHNAYVSLKTK